MIEVRKKIPWPHLPSSAPGVPTEGRRKIKEERNKERERKKNKKKRKNLSALNILLSLDPLPVNTILLSTSLAGLINAVGLVWCVLKLLLEVGAKK